MADESKLAPYFHELLDAAPDAILVIDGDGRIEFASKRAEELFGWTRPELVGQTMEMLVPERFRATHAGHRLRFGKKPTTRPMGSGLELFALRKDGKELPIEISLSPLQTPHGLLVTSAIRDISERKRSEALIRETAQNLSSAIEAIPGAFALFDDQDRLVLCNSTGQVFFGTGGGRIIGRTYNALLEQALEQQVFDLGKLTPAQFLERCIAYRRNPQGPLDVRTSDGHCLRITDRKTAEGGTVMTLWDITEDVDRETELQRLREVAEAASTAKSEFLASMSHELRTPLNAVLGFAQLLRRDKKNPLNERQVDMTEHVIKGGEHLLHLIDDILDLSRVESGRVAISPEPVSVAEVLEEVQSTLEPMARRAGIRIDASVPEDLPRIVADRTRFAQILMNYGSNAIKYGNKGGNATYSVSREGSRIRITLKDSGIGIPEDKQEKIFQPFHRAGQETGPIEGTGIGLAISKRLAEAMDGSVGFKSTRGQGSEFWVELPIVSEKAKQTIADAKLEHKHPVGARAAESTFSVVYVEDNPSNIAFMEEFISQLDGVELATAPTAEIGLELVRARQPNAVIMDINLPGMNGLEAVRLLKSWPETRSIPVIGLSAAAMKRDRKLAEEAGFFRYLTKPVNVDELTAALDLLMSEARAFGS